jgi:hypothetical protein
MPREASAADCPRMCKIFVKGPAPMVPFQARQLSRARA